MRRHILPLLTLVISLIAPRPIFADEDLSVWKPVDGSSPRRMLQGYLMERCQEHFDARRKAVATLKTPEHVTQRQMLLRAKFIEAIGGFPEKTPLNAAAASAP